MAVANAPIRKVIVIYNPRSGTLLAAGDDPEVNLRTLFAHRGVEAELHPFDLQALPNVIKSAEEGSADAVVVCGGDGSILALVDALGERKLPLGLIPGGTMNILARDIGLPTEPEAAVDVISKGATENIDVGFVNGQPFLCNSEIGFMTHLAKTREKLRELPWWRRWPAMITHGFTLMRSYPRLRVTFEIDGKTHRFRTRAIVVSNNLLSDAPGPIPGRETLRAGTLGIYVACDTSNWALLRIAARMMSGVWQSDAALETIAADSAILSLQPARTLSVMNDGELAQIQTPLSFTIRPRALCVLVPRINP